MDTFVKPISWIFNLPVQNLGEVYDNVQIKFKWLFLSDYILKAMF